jgi:hypothetical protein
MEVVMSFKESFEMLLNDFDAAVRTVKEELLAVYNSEDIGKVDSETGNNKATTRVSQALLNSSKSLKDLATKCSQTKQEAFTLRNAKKAARKAAASVAVPPPPAQ